MFDMKGSQLDGEVRFSNAIRHFRRDLNNYLNPSDVVDSPAIHSILHVRIIENIFYFSI